MMFLVNILLEAQTTLEPTATPGDFRGVERRFLHLGHTHRHGRHDVHMGVATDRLAAIAEVGEQFSLIAYPDLAKFDACVALAGQVFNEFAEVYSLLGQEEEDDPLAAEEMFDVYQFHLKLTLSDELPTYLQFLLFEVFEFEPMQMIGLTDSSDDASASRFGNGGEPFGRGGAEHDADFMAAFGAKNNSFIARIGELLGVKFAEVSHGTVSNDPVWHDEIVETEYRVDSPAWLTLADRGGVGKDGETPIVSFV